MIHFNELRYSKDNKYLIIDVEIDTLSYYKDMIIDTIMIDNQNTYINNGPSSTPIYTYKAQDQYDNTYLIPENCSCAPIRVDEDKSYCFTYGKDTMKHIRIEVPLEIYGINPHSDILFVYAIASGTPTPDTPCGYDNNKIMGTVIDLQGVYNYMMSYIREIEKDCSVPRRFIDSILRFKAIEIGVKTGNYPLVIKYWNDLIKKQQDSPDIKDCMCYGQYK